MIHPSNTQQYPEHILKQADEMAEKLAGAFGRNHVKHEYSDVELINKELNLPALLMAQEQLTAVELMKEHWHQRWQDEHASICNIGSALWHIQKPWDRSPVEQETIKRLEQLSQHQQVVKQLVGALEKNHKWHQEYDEYGGYPECDLFDTNCVALSTAKQLLEKKV